MSPETMKLHIGPQGPSQPGPYVLEVLVDEEEVVDARLDIGYIHKGMEKLAENRTYTGYIPLSDRICYVDSVNNNQAYCQAIEEIADIEVPERAKYLRVILMELQRIISHQLWLGEFMSQLGHFTQFMYSYRDREHIVEIFEKIIGGRLNMTTHRIGGLRSDILEGMEEEIRQEINYVTEKTKEYREILHDNDVFRKRGKEVGKLSEKEAKKLGVAGPVLRASGVRADIRKLSPYEIYDRFSFNIPVLEGGDVFDRTMLRLEEIQQSARIVRQALNQIPEGKIKNEDVSLLDINPPKDETYSRVESARGEFAIYLVSDGSDTPYRLKISGPTYSNMQAFPKVVKGENVADIYAIAGSLDFCVTEADR